MQPTGPGHVGAPTGEVQPKAVPVAAAAARRHSWPAFRTTFRAAVTLWLVF